MNDDDIEEYRAAPAVSIPRPTGVRRFVKQYYRNHMPPAKRPSGIWRLQVGHGLDSALIHVAVTDAEGTQFHVKWWAVGTGIVRLELPVGALYRWPVTVAVTT